VIGSASGSASSGANRSVVIIMRDKRRRRDLLPSFPVTRSAPMRAIGAALKSGQWRSHSEGRLRGLTPWIHARGVESLHLLDGEFVKDMN
jgi:hypothetical protein